MTAVLVSQGTIDQLKALLTRLEVSLDKLGAPPARRKRPALRLVEGKEPKR